MGLAPPSTLSPSKISKFKDCAMAFRFTAVDRLREPPTEATVRGTLLHSVLERFFWEYRGAARTPGAAGELFDAMWPELLDHPDLLALGPDEVALAAMRDQVATYLERYFTVEDPSRVRDVALELSVSATIGDLTLRGIIDRLDVDEDGALVVVDYKTGKAPPAGYTQAKLLGVRTYALLLTEVLGTTPSRVRLIHLGGRQAEVIEAPTTEATVKAQRNLSIAVWDAVVRSCETGAFAPRPGPLCNYCAFRQFCPAFGGDPSEAPAAFGVPSTGAPH